MKRDISKQEFNTGLLSSESNNREYLFDNLKAILIILVVWGHILTSMISNHIIIRSIYIFIFYFHMPAMVFISGFFSKKLEKIRDRAFVTILIPYMIINVIIYISRILIMQEEYYAFRFFNPPWGLWYLLTLFMWKFLLKDMLRIRSILPLSFILALASGFSKEASIYLASGRFICFLPFFLLGYYCSAEHVIKIRKFPKVISVLSLIVVGAWSFITASKDVFDIELLLLRTYYPIGEEIRTMFFRLIIYIVAVVMIIVLINLTSSSKTIISNIGASTMTVYVLHLFTIPVLEKYKILENNAILYLGYSVLMTAVITFVYSRSIVKNTYDKIMDKLTGLILRKEA